MSKETGASAFCTSSAAEVYDLGSHVTEYACDGSTCDLADPDTSDGNTNDACKRCQVIKE